jgi:hypothetical protein
MKSESLDRLEDIKKAIAQDGDILIRNWYLADMQWMVEEIERLRWDLDNLKIKPPKKPKAVKAEVLAARALNAAARRIKKSLKEAGYDPKSLPEGKLEAMARDLVAKEGIDFPTG